MVPGSLAEAGCHPESQEVGQVQAGTTGLGAGEFAGWMQNTGEARSGKEAEIQADRILANVL